MIRRVIGLLAVLCLLGGCAPTEFDASRYVQGILDSTYLERYDDYIELTGVTAEQAKDEFLQGLDAEADVFLQYYGIESVSQPVRDELISMYREIYQKSKYTVGEAQKTGEGYRVEVTISPIDIFSISGSAVDAKINELAAQSGGPERNDDLANGIIGAVRAYIPQIGYTEERTVSVLVYRDEEGLYGLGEDDFYSLDQWIIDYSL